VARRYRPESHTDPATPAAAVNDRLRYGTGDASRNPATTQSVVASSCAQQDGLLVHPRSDRGGLFGSVEWEVRGVDPRCWGWTMVDARQASGASWC